MKLILKSADFSADNIGQVPVRRHLDADTKSILALYSATPSEEVKYALDDFIITSKALGIYEKLQVLMLPFLGTSVDESTKNVIGNTIVSNKTSLKVSNKGIALTDPSSYSPVVLSGLSLSQNNISLNAYNNEASENCEATFGMFGDTYTLQRHHASADVMTSQGTALGSFRVLDLDSSKFTSAPSAYGISFNDNSVILSLGKNTSSFSGTTNTTPISKVNLLGYNAQTPKWTTKSAIGFISIGESMTEENAKLYNAAINKMMNVVLG